MLNTKTKSLVSQQPGQEQQQLIVNADAELISLQSQIEQAQQAIVSARSELSALDAKAQAWQTRLTTASSNAGQTKNAFDEGTTRATLSQGTAAAGQVNIAALRHQADRAQQEFTRLQIQLDREAQSDDQRRAQVQTSLDAQQRSLQSLIERTQLVRQVRDNAFLDQGAAIMAAYLETVAALQAQRDQAQLLLHNLDSELATTIHQASQELGKSWPDQQRAFSQHFAYNDSLTSILQAQIDLIDLVQTVGNGVQIPSEITRKLKMPWANLPELLSIQSAYWRPALAKESWGNAELLQDRKRQLRQLLDAYRDSQAENEVPR